MIYGGLAFACYSKRWRVACSTFVVAAAMPLMFAVSWGALILLGLFTGGVWLARRKGLLVAPSLQTAETESHPAGHTTRQSGRDIEDQEMGAGMCK